MSWFGLLVEPLSRDRKNQRRCARETTVTVEDGGLSSVRTVVTHSVDVPGYAGVRRSHEPSLLLFGAKAEGKLRPTPTPLAHSFAQFRRREGAEKYLPMQSSSCHIIEKQPS
jgi:hypothetical protein